MRVYNLMIFATASWRAQFFQTKPSNYANAPCEPRVYAPHPHPHLLCGKLAISSAAKLYNKHPRLVKIRVKKKMQENNRACGRTYGGVKEATKR